MSCVQNVRALPIPSDPTLEAYWECEHCHKFTSTNFEETVQHERQCVLRSRKKRLRPTVTRPPTMLVADPEDPVSFLQEHGYVLFRRALPETQCAELAEALERDILELQRSDDAGMGHHQEEPCERLTLHTQALLRRMQASVLAQVVKPRFPGAVVPADWTECLYGRVKQKHEYTRAHCDALNTIVERGFLQTPAARDALLRTRSSTSSSSCSCSSLRLPPPSPPRSPAAQSWDFKDVPIFTFWVPLRSLPSAAHSHLRLYVGSHAMPGIGLVRHARTGRPLRVAPRGYVYRKSLFVGPAAEDGTTSGGPYSAGDVLIFHCLTQHEANPHRPRAGRRRRATKKKEKKKQRTMSSKKGNAAVVRRLGGEDENKGSMVHEAPSAAEQQRQEGQERRREAVGFNNGDLRVSCDGRLLIPM